MPKIESNPLPADDAVDLRGESDECMAFRHQQSLLKKGALQDAIFNSASFSCIATDEKGVIQIFNVGAERMLGFAAFEVVNRITPAALSDPQELIARAAALSLELKTPISPGFEAMVFKASRGIEDIYELTKIRKDGSSFPAVVSVTALRDPKDEIIGYLLIGTDNTARKQAEDALQKTGALQNAIFNSANFSSIATDAKGVIQIFNVGAERMLGYTAAEVTNRITPADISDPQEVIVRAEALSAELDTPITPGFDALVFKASRGIEDIYELTYFRKDGSRFPAVVSVTALRDAHNAIIGYLLIGTDNTARKQAEDALLKAGALQSAIFNSANFSSIATDAKGVIQIFNVGAERMLGFAALEVMNRITPAEISDPEELIERAAALSVELGTLISPGFEALVFKASRGIEDIYELTYVRKDGSRFPAIVSVTALRDARESIIGYLLIGTDNTARKQVEAAQALLDSRLREQQFYTRSLIESNSDALMMTDPQGIISDVNAQMMALTGRTRDELIGAPCRNFFTDPLRADAAIRRVLAENRVNNYELTVCAKNGEQTVVSYNAGTFYNRDNKLQGVFAAARDITERKKAETQLRESEARTSAILAAALDAIIIIDATGTIESLNAATEKLFGYTENEMVGQNFKMLMPAPNNTEHDGYLPNHTGTALKKIIGIGREMVGLRKNGETFPMDLAVSEVHTGGRRLFTAIVRDITERKRIERALQEKNVELEHASRMKSEFLATMSHELRTPLNAIIGFSEALKDGLMGPMSATQHEYAGDIFTSGQHLLSLINDILDLSKVEAGMMTLELEAVDLNSLLANSLSIVKEKAAAHNIALELDAGDDLGTPLLDLRKTKQIVYNLLSNAVKFSERGGRVTLRSRRVARSAVGTLSGDWPVRTFSLADNAFQEFIEIGVGDNGIGIARDNMAKLFLAFSQIDSSLARKFEGTGLGLAMVKQLAELHGGSVAVSSAEGEGACFAVWLPLRAATPVDSVEAESGPGRARVALVIENDAPSADLLRVLLEHEGFTVLHAESAEAALRLAPQHCLSLITLELELPGMNGWEFLLRLRESGPQAQAQGHDQANDLGQVPVVIVAIKVERHLALACGAAAVLEKPVSRTQLKTTLAGLGLQRAPARPHTVLVVDDDPKAVEVMAALLPPPDYAVVRAYGGGEAIALAQRLHPDLILLDLIMPEVSGFDVAEALGQRSDTARIPIVVVSSKHVTAQERAALNQHPEQSVHIVEKAGFNRRRFVAEVRRVLLAH